MRQLHSVDSGRLIWHCLHRAGIMKMLAMALKPNALSHTSIRHVEDCQVHAQGTSCWRTLTMQQLQQQLPPSWQSGMRRRRKPGRPMKGRMTQPTCSPLRKAAEKGEGSKTLKALLLRSADSAATSFKHVAKGQGRWEENTNYILASSDACVRV